MARKFSPFEQAACGDPLIKVVAVQKEIVLAIAFAAAGGTGGG